MKTIYKTYKFRMYPNTEQVELLGKYFGCTRFVYNYFLNERMEQYKATQKSDNYYDQAKKLTLLKKHEEFVWLNEINSQTLQHSLRHLESAYLNFFRGNAKFPRFKSRKDRNSFVVPQFCSVVGNSISLPKFKSNIKIKKHQEISGNVRSMTVSKDCDGKYYVAILTEQLYEPIQKSNKSVGIDLGLKDFVITSDGKVYKNHRYTKKYERKLSKAQRHLSRKQKDSRSFENQRRKVVKIHKKISNSRNDVLHKVSTELVRNYDIICCENLNVKGMIKNHKLAKHIADVSWGTFVNYLEYKCEREDKTLVKINRYFPSSQTCSDCGYINQSIKDLCVREWTCPKCGKHHNRDLNAAINILREGLTTLSAGTVDYTGGDDVRLACKQLSAKPEAHKSLVCE